MRITRGCGWEKGVRVTHARVVDEEVQFAARKLSCGLGCSQYGFGVLHIERQRLDPQAPQMLELREVASSREHTDAAAVEFPGEGIPGLPLLYPVMGTVFVRLSTWCLAREKSEFGKPV